MTVYYRGRHALITEDVLEVWSPQHRVFHISELTNIYVVDGGSRWSRPLWGRRRTPWVPYELRAIHRGVDVLLFSCTDARTFGQVRRALARVRERHADRV
jgi:Family of unknown function (DUF6232)